MDNPQPSITIPEQASTAQLRLVRVRTLNEIAFLSGDRAHGGPARETELAALRHTLHQLDARIAAASQS